MSVTIVEKYPQNKKGGVAVKPYFDSNMSNMGLEKYGLSLFDGVFHEEQLACLEVNGIKRYVTGLNEFAPEVKFLPEDEREAKINEIRRVVSQLEKELAANVVSPDDAEFWNKIKLLKPDNDEFWSKVVIRCGNEPLFLEPAKDPYDLIKLYAINAGGFSIVAKSYDEARQRPVPPKFYLDIAEETVVVKTELKKMRNKALSELQKMYDKNATKMFYVAKVLDIDSAQYKRSTPNDIIYDNMDKYINGETVERNKKLTAERFLDVAANDLATLKLRAVVKDAAYFKYIVTKSDGFIYHLASSTMLGRTFADVVEFLKNPINQDLSDQIITRVEQHWKD
jgi:hypothetical protein